MIKPHPYSTERINNQSNKSLKSNFSDYTILVCSPSQKHTHDKSNKVLIRNFSYNYNAASLKLNN